MLTPAQDKTILSELRKRYDALVAGATPLESTEKQLWESFPTNPVMFCSRYLTVLKESMAQVAGSGFGGTVPQDVRCEDIQLSVIARPISTKMGEKDDKGETEIIVTEHAGRCDLVGILRSTSARRTVRLFQKQLLPNYWIYEAELV